MCANTLIPLRRVRCCYFFLERNAHIVPVYAPDMPSSLPPLLLIRRLIQHVLLTLLFVARGIAVATIWLGVLPWVTVWTWRMYFSMGESTYVTNLFILTLSDSLFKVLGGSATVRALHLQILRLSTIKFAMMLKFHSRKVSSLESVLTLYG